MPKIITRSALPFDPWNPDIDLIRIEDAAESLSKTCRFNGHCIGMYTVSEHSRLVARNVPSEHKLTALLHDLPEGLGLGDMVSPVKRGMHAYKQLEATVWAAVALKFELPMVLPDVVQEADMRALATERRDLVPEHAWDEFDWECLHNTPAYDEVLVPNEGAYHFAEERDLFLEFFERCWRAREALRA